MYRWVERTASLAVIVRSGSRGLGHQVCTDFVKRMYAALGRYGRGLAEEAAFAYKDVEAVVRVVTRAGLAAPVAQLAPIGVVKG